MRVLPLLMAFLLAVTTLTGAVGAVGSGPSTPTTAPAVDGDPVPEVQQRAPADPDGDPIGWEGGYWHNESVDVDQSDGLSEAELDAYVARSMARVEYLRGREFTQPVDVSVELRSEYRNRTESAESNETFAAWNNQVWEALLIDGEDSNVQDELKQTSAQSVVGFYSIRDDEIKIITETPDRPVIDNTTLIHELVHAMQDQYYEMDDGRFHGGTQDKDLAVQGIVEGEANYIESRYVDRCGETWDCVETPSQPRSDGEPPNFGILLTVIQPYSDGPVYVDWLKQRGGWAAVDRRFDDPPASTEQVIHRTDESPGTIAFDDKGRNGWQPFPKQGENGSDTVGEASMYVMFWVQSRNHDAGVIDWRGLLRTDHPDDQFDYRSEPSAGWDHDRLFPYRKQTGTGTEYGYVWLTKWDSERDAREFHQAYLTSIEAHGGGKVSGDVYRIPDGPYEDAFSVVRRGRTVRIVNGPTVGDLDDIRPGSGPTDSGAGDMGESAGAGDDAGGEFGGEGGIPAPPQPGFDPLATLLGVGILGGLGWLARRRR